MDTSRKIEYWRDIADYDMKTARSMQKSGRYLYTVFMCEQALEKMMKALYMKKFGKEAPWSHNLVYLQGLVATDVEQSALELFAELTTYYIEGRYPSYKRKLSTLVNKQKSGDVLKRTSKVYAWLRRTVK